MQAEAVGKNFIGVEASPAVSPRKPEADALAEASFTEGLRAARERTDRYFSVLLPAQWAAAIGVALWLSPPTLAGAAASIHSHVWMTLIFGGVLAVPPALLAWSRPGKPLTRHLIAAGEMLMGSLLIHLSGGRIETHFFLFGSLVFLATYGDVWVLATATVVVVIDHVLRGVYLPLSLFGVVPVSLWRTAEHAAWILYEEAFLWLAMSQVLHVMRRMSRREAEVRISKNDLWANREALAASERENRKLIERSPFGIYRSTPEGRVTLANPALVGMLGYGSLRELMEVDLNCKNSPHLSRAESVAMIESDGEVKNLEFKWLRPDGGLLLLRENARVVRGPDGEVLYYEGMLEDITERHQLHEQLVFRAHHDALTGLPNRLLLADRMRQALARSEREATMTAVLCIDVDRFKQVNDLYGHHVGDLFLQELVRRISGRLRTVDTFARIGGDEFVVVLGELGEAGDATAIADDLLSIMRPLVEADGQAIQASISVGMALFPEDGCGAEELHRHADQALYRAKMMGRGQHRRFTRDLGHEAEATMEMEVQLRHAIEQGGFELHYQPLVNADRSMAGLEALLRFRHPRLGLVPPSRFIPLAEQNGMIVPIGEWVLEEACRQSMAWQRSGLGALPIAVNVSARQLGPDFVSAVAEVLRETGLEPGLLELELTESFVMADFEESARVITRLKRLGVRIAVDDFGTGYSSLSYLHRLPIDVVKIDHSFIESVAEAGGTRPIVEAIVTLAHTLGMRTVAEGVETEEQFEVLRKLGCNQMQGYLFARPEVAERVGRRMELVAGIRG